MSPRRVEGGGFIGKYEGIGDKIVIKKHDVISGIKMPLEKIDYFIKKNEDALWGM